MKATHPKPDESFSDDYTTRDVAKRLGLAVRSIQQMVDRGEFEAWKTHGGHRRISRKSVERWEAARLSTATAAVTAPRNRRATDRPAQPGADPGDARPMKILLIEDSVHFQNLVALLVKQHFPDAELRTAGDGIIGLAMYGQFQPDVMLVDILLPGIDGATLIATLRSHPQFASSRLIVVTSLDESQRGPYAFALEGVPVVHKTALVAELPALLAAPAGATATAVA
ncbi:DNA-binding protein [Rhodoferax koreense]|uniref:DNA-binding protein n=1 Tax=Rhodoferax koreensis TaxID=1842727 RepID=A0A1P8JU01_9BURK|nr:helix-turn-helix domain-containing protein [Rhodoferax koreense]APW37246.1 DNA-binding protein [Rhodoferax koreense]